MARSDPSKKRFVVVCPACGRRWPVGMCECPDDGTRLEGRTVIVCPTCGRENPAESRVCLEDGTPLFHEPRDADEAPAPPSPRPEPPTCCCEHQAELDPGEEPRRLGG